MVSEITKKFEFFCLDFFIYVLSESNLFRRMVQITYELVTDKRFLAKFLATVIVAGMLGLGAGLAFSAISEILI